MKYPTWLTALDCERIEEARTAALELTAVARVIAVAQVIVKVLSVERHAAPWPMLAKRQAFADRFVDTLIVEDAYPATQPVTLVIIGRDVVHSTAPPGPPPPTREQVAEQVRRALQSCPEWVAFQAAVEPFSTQLARLLKKARWSVDDLANAANVDRTNIFDHLKGTATPRRDTVQKIETALTARLKRSATFDL